MACLCTANTLKLFIKSVAQVDLPSSTLRTCPKQWQTNAIRSFSSTRRIGESHFVSNREIPFDSPPPKTQEQQAGAKSWPQGSAEKGSVYASDGQAEAERITVKRSAPVKSRAPVKQVEALSKVARRKKERYSDGAPMPAAEIKPVIRRTKTENTSLTIHYSAPRAPLNSETPSSVPKPDRRSKPNTSNPGGKEDEWTPPPREHWQLDKAALKEKFPEGWKPLKKLSPDALAGIRALHAQSPEQYTTEVLANSFKISPEAVRRILKSKWTPNSEEETDRQRRWMNRGKSIYTRHADMGQKPPKKWRDMGIGKGKPEWMLRNKRVRERAPLPALITTSRARDMKYGLNGPGGGEGFEHRIL
jgi:hypothetical protein